jgi:putative tricarboxylic transport membrane protein
MKLSDRVSGLSLAVLGAVAFAIGSRLPPVPGQQVGPNVFPMVIGAGLVLVGLLIALHIGRSFEEAAEAEVAAHTDADAEAARYAHARRWHVLLPPGLLVFYFLASERLGFLITAFVILTTLAYAFRARRAFILPLGIGGALAIQLVFVKLLRVPLPPGLLAAPW